MWYVNEVEYEYQDETTNDVRILTDCEYQVRDTKGEKCVATFETQEQAREYAFYLYRLGRN